MDDSTITVLFITGFFVVYYVIQISLRIYCLYRENSQNGLLLYRLESQAELSKYFFPDQKNDFINFMDLINLCRELRKSLNADENDLIFYRLCTCSHRNTHLAEAFGRVRKVEDLAKKYQQLFIRNLFGPDFPLPTLPALKIAQYMNCQPIPLPQVIGPNSYPWAFSSSIVISVIYRDLAEVFKAIQAREDFDIPSLFEDRLEYNEVYNSSTWSIYEVICWWLQTPQFGKNIADLQEIINIHESNRIGQIY